MHFANCAVLAAVLFTTLIENFETVRLPRMELFLNFEQSSLKFRGINGN